MTTSARAQPVIHVLVEDPARGRVDVCVLDHVPVHL